MPTWTGYFNSTGAPAIKILLSGVIQKNRTEFEALIDTGFSGFISIPILDAFPLGLVLRGSMRITYGDGASSDKLYALGEVSIGKESGAGLIILEEGPATVLVGMEFLRIFRKRLIVSAEANTVVLEDEPQSQPTTSPPTPTP